jgi:hypothetical protein
MLLRLALVLSVAIACVSFVAVLGAPHAAHRSSAATCETPLDLMLVIDGSGSIFASDFNRVKDFSNGLADSFAIGESAARIGVVQFSGEGQGRIESGLSGNAAAVHGAIDGMIQIEGYTDIQEGLALGQGEIAANGRAGVPHVIILLTDGQQEGAPGDPVAEAEAARAAGTQIYAVGVGGGPNTDQLNAIASDPDGTYVYSVEDFNSLQTIRDQLVATACPVPTAATSTRTPTGQPSSTPVPPSTPGGTPTPTATPGGSNDDPGSCTPVSSGTETHAAIDTAGDVDYFCISGGAGQQLIVNIDAYVKGSPLDAIVTLFDKDGVTVLAENDDGENVDPYLEYELSNAGTYYLRVQSFGHPCCGGPGYAYLLVVQLVGGSPPPTATPTPTHTFTPPPGGSNDTPGSCTPVSSGTETHAAIDAAGDVDYFCISGVAGQQLLVNIDAYVKGSPLDAIVTLFDKDGATVLAENDDSDSVDPYLEYELPNAGTFYLRVQSYAHPCCGGPSYVYLLIVQLVGGSPPPTATPTRTRTPTPALPPADDPSLLGDVNCDAVVNAIDAAYILQYVAGFLPQLPCPNKADVDEDGSVTAIDAAVILQYSAALIDDLPP